MRGDITFSSSVIRNSIVNDTNVSGITEDNTAPFSFLQFITNTGVDYTPEEYNNFYISYLKDWSDIKNTQSTTDSTNFVKLYVDFLQELTLTYSTQQELKFLSTLDFTSATDLDIIIPFYAEKIRQVILFYKEKRDIAKYSIDRNKIKGTSHGIEKILFDKIYNYVFAVQGDPTYGSISLTLSGLQTYLDIDVQEYVDVYGNYFDLPSLDTPFVKTNREDIDINLFFDDPTSIFTSKVFLIEIPLAINTAITYDSICDPTNPVQLALNACEAKTGLTVDQRAQLKVAYLKKYSGVDMYYIDTTVTPYVSGVLYTADSPTNNIQNIQNIYTPTVESNMTKLLRDIGLFFKPDKTGIFQLNANKYTYTIVTSSLEANKLYMYPDPSVYGNVTINYQQDYPLVFTYDNRPDIRNTSSTFAAGDPYILPEEQTFSPYFTRQQTIHRTEAKDNTYSLNFNDLYNTGYIAKYQTDIYGNEYALFKDRVEDTFTTTNGVLNLLCNGHVFYDTNEGYNFNYSTTSTVGTTIRSGISTLTVNNPSSPSFGLTGSNLFLFFREFLPYQDLRYRGFNSAPTAEDYVSYEGAFRDGGGFAFPNNESLPDYEDADLYDYPGNGLYYYTLLADGGVASLSPLTRATTETPIVTEFLVPITTEDNSTLVVPVDTADFTLDVKFVLSSADVSLYDCGYFSTEVVLGNDYNYSRNYKYYDTLSPNCDTVYSTLSTVDNYKTITDKRSLAGKIFVKNAYNTSSQSLSDALAVVFNKYSAPVRAELYNTPLHFEVFYDTIVVETPNYVVIDKIDYTDGEFVTPKTKNTVFEKNNTHISPFSTRFYDEKSNILTFCIINTVQTLSAYNKKAIYPTIYQHNLRDNTTTTLYPKSSDVSSLSATFNLSSFFTDTFNVNIVAVEKPVLTYNSLNTVFKLNYIGVDNNNYFHMFDVVFDIINDNVRFLDINMYRTDKTLLTTNFAVSSTIFSTIHPVSGGYSINTITGSLSL